MAMKGSYSKGKGTGLASRTGVSHNMGKRSGLASSLTKVGHSAGKSSGTKTSGDSCCSPMGNGKGKSC